MSANAPADTTYVDTKRRSWLSSVIVPPLLLPLGAGLAFWTGWSIFFWLPLLVSYTLYPVLDYWLGEDEDNPPESAVDDLEADPYYRYLTYAIIPLQFAVFIWAAWLVGTGGLGWFAILGLSLSMGALGGIAINTGHELGHKKGALERALAKISLIMVGYGHFYIEHNKGHHRDVATPEDPASARMGENLYQFAAREIPGAMRRAWRLESQRLRRKGKHPLSLENDIVQTTLGTALLYGGVLAAFGWWPVLAFLAIHTAYGYFQLTMANFVEHYGLLRQKEADGRYERPLPEHSWNSNHAVTNLVLFHLQRHSDHHAYPTRRYQALRHYDDAPQLPSGYALMFLVAQIPPLWRKVMYPRLLKHVGHDLNKVNLDPKKRDELFARYHRPQEAAA